MDIFDILNVVTTHSTAITATAFLFVASYLLFVKRRYGYGKVERLHKRNIRTSKKLHKKLQSGFSDAQLISYLRKTHHFIFEELILTALDVRKGLKIKRSPRYTGDGGADGEFWLCGTRYLIQAKCYSKHINNAHVEDFKNLVSKSRCKGIFVHTGRTGKKAWSNLDGSIQVISGSNLVKLIKTGAF